jgi:hypothetical protein
LYEALASMSRAERLLLFTLALVGLIVGGLFMVYRLQDVPKSTRPLFQNTTAMEAYAIAEPVARQWATDAMLLNISAAWQPGLDFQTGETSWSLTFYSADQSEMSLISIIDKGATLTNSRTIEGLFDPEDMEEWQVDSPQAISQLMSTGGQEFMDREGSANLTMRLNLDGQTTWKSTLINKDSRRTFSLSLNANSGKIIETVQSE